MDHDLRFHDFANLYLRLNSQNIPKITSDQPQFPQNERVQAPLRQIFETYIDCYLVFIRQYAQASDKYGKRIFHPSGSNTDGIRN